MRAFEEGKKHSEPSPETLKFMTDTGRFMEKVNVEISYIKNELISLNAKVVDEDKLRLIIKETQEVFREQSSKLYAARWTEKIIAGMVGAILITVLGAVLKIIVL